MEINVQIDDAELMASVNNAVAKDVAEATKRVIQTSEFCIELHEGVSRYIGSEEFLKASHFYDYVNAYVQSTLSDVVEGVVKKFIFGGRYDNGKPFENYAKDITREVIYANKDEIIEYVSNRATAEVKRHAIRKTMDMIAESMMNDEEPKP